jgi:hypothetical protein
MLGASLAVGDIVVVQFGPSDAALTRCTVTEVSDNWIVLTPSDALSGSGAEGEPARLFWSRRPGQTTAIDVIVSDGTTASHVVLVPDRRREVRHSLDLRVGITVVGEAVPVRGRLRDLSLGGLRAHLDESLPSGLRGFVRISDYYNELLAVPGEIVGMSSTGPVGVRDTHMRFVDITDSTLERLEALISGTGSADLQT